MKLILEVEPDDYAFFYVALTRYRKDMQSLHECDVTPSPLGLTTTIKLKEQAERMQQAWVAAKYIKEEK